MSPAVTINPTRPEDLYDWGGAQLDPSLRQHLTVGQVVRLQVNYPRGQWEAVYVAITADEGTWLVGTVLDTYRQFFEGETIYLDNGETLRFPRASVLEIPLDWEANAALQPLAQYTGLERNLTGGRPTEAP